MSTTQELIERLKAWADRERDAARGFDDALSFAAMEACEITEGTLRAAAARLASLSAENAALKAKLAGVDEKGLEAGARALIESTSGPWEMFDATGQDAARIEARAAIAAYLAAVGG